MTGTTVAEHAIPCVIPLRRLGAQSHPPAVRREQQLREIAIALAVKPSHVLDPPDPRIDRVRMLAENAGGLLHIHVCVRDRAQRLNERA